MTDADKLKELLNLIPLEYTEITYNTLSPILNLFKNKHDIVVKHTEYDIRMFLDTLVTCGIISIVVDTKSKKLLFKRDILYGTN